MVTEAQDTTIVRKRNNEFGIDATPFIKQFLNFSQGSQYAPPETYVPTYYLTYRHYFSNGNLRAAIGGNFENTSTLGWQSWNDTVLYKTISYNFNARIGWEFTNKLGKKWNVFYGLDFLANYSYSKSDSPNSLDNIGNYLYVDGTITNTLVVAIAPMLGIKLNITKRLSLSTETSYSINWEQDNNNTYWREVSPQAPYIQGKPSPTERKVYSTFYEPVSLFIEFAI